jgi:hypothetical protein
MGRLYFGRQEEIRCIVDVDIHGVDNEPLCLAYKTTTFHVGGGVYFRDDGYVLKARAWHQDRYYPLDPGTLQGYQSAGALPNPLPGYAIPIADYLWGYAMWIILAGMIGSGAVRRHRQASRRRIAESLLAGDAVESAAPTRTEADSFVTESVAPLLRSGETALHQGYVVDRDADSAGAIGALFARGLFAVLTTQRLILISTRLGLFGPALVNRGVESIERDSIRDAGLDGNALVLDLAEGGTKRLVIRVNETALSNQRTFARDVLQSLASRSEGSPAPGGQALHPS